MLFLLNDQVLRLDSIADDMRSLGAPVRALEFPAVIRMGQVAFAQDPALQRRSPDVARQLCALICAKAPSINAALFLSPRPGCSPDEVRVRFVNLEFRLVAELFSLQKAGGLTPAAVDGKVWARLAA
jgi:hypothetical protein